MDDDQIISYPFDFQHEDNFISHLLEQPIKEGSIDLQQPPTNLIQGNMDLPNDLDVMENCGFVHGLLDPEQVDRSMPDRVLQEAAEENFILTVFHRESPERHTVKQTRKNSKIERVGYLQETRRDKLQRYRDKKSKRKWGHKICYDCRKVVADSRVRINGRFVKKSPFVNALQVVQGIVVTMQLQNESVIEGLGLKSDSVLS